jgi:hypothetical protein
MRKKKIFHQENVVDFRTKEIISETKVYSIPSEPSFVKMYIDDLSLLNGLGKNGNDVLREVVKYMDYAGEIVLTPERKSNIAEKYNINVRTVRNQLSILVKKGILAHKTYLTFVANPQLFSKGEWKNIQKLRDSFQLIIEYKNGKRTVKGKSHDSDYDDQQQSI